MITKVMNHCKKHYPKYYESPDITFKAVGEVYTIEADFAENYIVGQYIWIRGSLLNDGAYKITDKDTGVLTVDTAVINELPTDNDDTVYIFGLAVPKDFLDLVSDISTWNTKYSGKAGISSESLDGYSISLQGGTNNTGLTWTNAFAGRLSDYKEIYDDIERALRYGYC